MKTVWVLALDGLLDSSLSITLDLLRVAQSLLEQSKSPARIEWRVVSSRATVKTGAGLQLRADATFAKAQGAPDWVIVPALGEYGARLAARLAQRDIAQA